MKGMPVTKVSPDPTQTDQNCQGKFFRYRMRTFAHAVEKIRPGERPPNAVNGTSTVSHFIVSDTAAYH